MSDLTRQTQNLIKNIDESLRVPPVRPGTTISISHAVSKAAVLYEMARNAVEFRAEHLLRRAAIERILKRRFITNSSGEGVGELLVRELLWARYLDEEKVNQEKVDEVQETVLKYIDLKNRLAEGQPKNGKNQISDWLVGLASCEIEKKLSPAPVREALINYVYRTLKEKVAIEDIKNEKARDIQVYIAVHQAFAESDLPIIRFHLFLTYFPDWMETDRTGIDSVLPRFGQAFQEIENYLAYPQANNLRRLLKREMAPFLIIRDLVDKNPDEFKNIVSNPDKLEEEARKILKQKYQQTGAKLRRAATRSIIYIFLTKMVFALILELPFDLIIGKTNLIALGINTLFPPLLMFIVTASIRVPGEENTKKIIAKINEYCYPSAGSKTQLKLSQITKRSRLGSIFHFIYLLTSLIIFGLIFGLLIRLHFNPISMAIFLFFVCVVLFFGYRVRLITKDYVIQEKEGALVQVADFFSLPILRVGQILSAELAQINLLIFIFDFVIEAPFKAFFELLEEWFKFVRIKKEEITV